MYSDDPWSLPSLSALDEDTIPTRVDLPLSITQTTYQAILDPTVDPDPSFSRKEEEDIFAFPA